VKYPLFGAALATGMLSCAVGVWPGTHDPYPTGAATGAPPILLVGTTGDPATPYAQTAKLAAMLGDAHIVTWDGEGHTAYPQTSCVVNAVDAYLINLTVPKPGLTCPANS
jgi:TAP-like protein